MKKILTALLEAFAVLMGGTARKEAVKNNLCDFSGQGRDPLGR